MLQFRGLTVWLRASPSSRLTFNSASSYQRALNDRIFGHGFAGFVESLGQPVLRKQIGRFRLLPVTKAKTQKLGEAERVYRILLD